MSAGGGKREPTKPARRPVSRNGGVAGRPLERGSCYASAMKGAWFALVAGLCLASCGRSTGSSEAPAVSSRPTSTFKEGPDAAAVLSRRLSRDGTVILRSHRGRWIGTDVDTDLQLSPEGKAKLIAYGIGVKTWSGRYHVSPEGALTFQAEDLPQGWPVLILGADRDDLQARPQGPPGPFTRGTEHWPLRSIPIENRDRRIHD
jgi:hypothetical protein